MSEWIIGYTARMREGFHRLKVSIKSSEVQGVTQSKDEKGQAVVFVDLGKGAGKYIEGDLCDFFTAYYARRRFSPMGGRKSKSLVDMALDLTRCDLIEQITNQNE